MQEFLSGVSKVTCNSSVRLKSCLFSFYICLFQSPDLILQYDDLKNWAQNPLNTAYVFCALWLHILSVIKHILVTRGVHVTCILLSLSLSFINVSEIKKKKSFLLGDVFKPLLSSSCFISVSSLFFLCSSVSRTASHKFRFEELEFRITE